MPFSDEEDLKTWLLFLKALLKGKSYVAFAYMTGILPIAKYSEGSELNMFLEYDMATKIRFGEYFGFSESEVDMWKPCYNLLFSPTNSRWFVIPSSSGFSQI